MTAGQDGGAEDNRLADAAVVADLDGDGMQDVLTEDLDQTQTSSGDWHEDTTIGVLSGSNGRPLWSIELGVTNGGVVPLPARVGSHGEPGVLVLTFHLDLGTVEIRAFGGRGRLLWRTKPVAPSPGPGAVVFHGAVTSRRDPVRLLVSWFTPAESGGSGGSATSNPAAGMLQLGLLDGVDGRIHALGDPLPVAGAAPQVFAVPDLDGDGADDALVAMGRPGGGQVQAISTRTGAPLWRTNGLDLGENAYVEGPAQNAVGDSRPDLLLHTYVWSPSTMPTVEPPPGQTCTVLDGATGAAVAGAHLSPDSGCMLNGDSDGDGRADVLLWQVGTTPSGAALDVRAWSPAHEAVGWSRRLVIRGAVAHAEDLVGYVLPDGDSEPDGSQELGYELQNTQSGVATSGVLDGRTGRVRFGAGMRPLGSVDGHGDDLVRVTGEFALVRHITTVDGLTGLAGGTYRLGTRYGAVLVDISLLRGRTRCSRSLLVVGSSLSNAGPVAQVLQRIDLSTGATRWARNVSGDLVPPYTVSRRGTELRCG